ncbi:MAG: ABC transporter permease [Anaerolineae bacterium]|nr:ABC transporter permease [Anaerolineae bacterium]
MKALVVAHKTLVEIAREPQMFGLVVLLPLLFLVITATTYTGSLLVTYQVAVTGAAPDDPLLQKVAALHYSDGRPVFALVLMDDRAAADSALKEQEVTALLVFAPDGGGVTLVGDALYGRFYRASTILSNLIVRHAAEAAGRVEPVRIVEEPLVAAGPETEFDLYAPGMMIFAWLMIIPQTAMLVAREVRWHTLRRLRLTRLSAWHFLGGISVSQMVVAVVQVAAVFAAALALGFHNRGSLPLAVAIGLAISFSAVGLGLITAAFSENDSQAANIGSTFAMLQVFLSGAFYQMPALTLFQVAGHRIGLFDVFPATHGFMALQQVLCYGCGLEQVGFRLAAAAVLSALYFVAGVAVFGRVKMRDRL